jgi:hypothetical protein
MALYLYRFGWAPDGWRAMMENPQHCRDSTGPVRQPDTAVLISVDEMVEAMSRAKEFGYARPEA